MTDSTGMTDAEIEQYVHSVRKWPRLPTDYDAATESIIRRYLRGEIVIDTDGNIRGRTPEPEEMGETAPEGRTRTPVADDQLWLKLDAKANYELAIDTIRRRR